MPSCLRRLTLALVACVVLAVPAAANAANPIVLYDDCQDNGRLDGRYSQADMRKALAEMPEDFREYEDCDEQIQAAQLGLTRGDDDAGQDGAVGGGAAGAGGGPVRDLPQGNGVGSVPLGPDGQRLDPEIDARQDERAGLNAARAGTELAPTTAGVRPGEPDNELPAALIVVLVITGLGALGVGGAMARQLVARGAFRRTRAFSSA